MKRKYLYLSTILILTFVPLFIAQNVFANGYESQQEGVRFRIDEIDDPLSNYTAFKIRITNTTDEQKVLTGMITLFGTGSSGFSEDAPVSECSVYVEVLPKSQESAFVHCLTIGHSRWKFTFEGIFSLSKTGS